MSVCRHPECTRTAFARIVTPYGTGNFCYGHGRSVLDRAEPDLRFPEWLVESFSVGEVADPPMDEPVAS
jgi:hypothetical protein